MKKENTTGRIHTVGTATWEHDTHFTEWLKARKIQPGSFKKYQEATKNKWFDTYHKEQLDTLPKEEPKAEEPKAPETKEQKTEKKKAEKVVLITLPDLKATIEKALPDGYEWSTHTDPNKKKVMVRWKGSKMLFKVFIQKKEVKVHLKTKDAWKAYDEKVEPFYQNGFNLPFAVKMSLDDFTNKFLPWVTTKHVETLAAPTKKEDK